MELFTLSNDITSDRSCTVQISSHVRNVSCVKLARVVQDYEYMLRSTSQFIGFIRQNEKKNQEKNLFLTV